MPKNSKDKSEPKKLSDDKMKDLLLIDTYKLALTRSQVEALAEIMIKKRIMTYEEFWKLTNEKFKNSKV